MPTTPRPVAGSFMHVHMCVYGLSCCPSGHDIDIDIDTRVQLVIILNYKAFLRKHLVFVKTEIARNNQAGAAGCIQVNYV